MKKKNIQSFNRSGKLALLLLMVTLLTIFSCNDQVYNFSNADEHKLPFNNIETINNSMAISPDEKFAVVSYSANPKIEIYDMTTKKKIKELADFITPRNIVFSKDGQNVYVTDSGSGDIVEIETSGFTIKNKYAVGQGIFGSTLSSDGSILYINNAKEHSLVVFDLVNKKVTHKVEGLNQPRQGLILDPKANILYVTNFGNDKVRMIDLTTYKIIGEIGGFNKIRALSISSDGTTLYAANSGSDAISIINIAERKIVKDIAVGKSPYGCALSPDNTFILTGNQGDNTVSYINLATQKQEFVITGFQEPRQAILYSKDGKFAYVLNKDLSIRKVDIENQSISQVIPAL